PRALDERLQGRVAPHDRDPARRTRRRRAAAGAAPAAAAGASDRAARGAGSDAVGAAGRGRAGRARQPAAGVLAGRPLRRLGRHRDPIAARAVLRRLRSLEVDFIDTADSYGPFVSEDLICEVLHPYDGIKVATKAGLTRSGASQWAPVGRREYLRQCCEMSLR